jgi:hypothetical protein
MATPVIAEMASAICLPGVSTVLVLVRWIQKQPGTLGIS